MCHPLLIAEYGLLIAPLFSWYDPTLEVAAWASEASSVSAYDYQSKWLDFRACQWPGRASGGNDAMLESKLTTYVDQIFITSKETLRTLTQSESASIRK